VLSRPAGDKVREAIAQPSEPRLARRSGRAAGRAGDGAPDEAAGASGNPVGESSRAGHAHAGNGSGGETATEARAKGGRRIRKTEDGLPEGWVIDDEGYVVPKHG
jgi:hypothetical protein